MIDPSPAGRATLAEAEAVPAEAVPARAARSGVRSRWTSSVRAALSMMTRIPIAEHDAATGARAFAIVGGLVGLVGSIPLVALGQAVPAIASILSVAVMAALSGAIHLDGLADTADAIVAVGPDAAERARKDPAVGVAGAAALILVLGLDVAALGVLLADGGTVFAAVACVVAATMSRLVPLAIVLVASPSPPRPGLGAWFAARVSRADAAIAIATGLAIAAVAALSTSRGELLAVGIVGALIGTGLSVGFARVRRQVDGDLLGAGVELGFAGTLLTAAILVSSPVR